jgi:Stress responsive A/B Barrel Domain
MLRRFEIYTLASGVSGEDAARLADVFRHAGRYIPELEHSVVGMNLSPASVDLVWEHSYASPEAYQRYMVHPYHANVLDRYLLNDSPERLVTDSPLGDGVLVGYACDEPAFVMNDGVRKVVLLGLDGHAERGAELVADLRRLPDTVPGAVLSVVEPNTMGVAWFDGVNAILPPSAWTHVWELGFESLEAYEAYQAGDSEPAVAERHNWRAELSDVVTQAVELHYHVRSGAAA